MKTEREKLKRRIVALIKRSGLPVGTQYIVDRVTLPEDIVLKRPIGPCRYFAWSKPYPHACYDELGHTQNPSQIGIRTLLK
jgi:hypothetical protein